MEKKTIGELDEQSMRLAEFLRGQEVGADLSYLQIEVESGVKMNLSGKAHLRRALRRLKLEYSCRVGYGVRLADASAVMPILSTRICRIDSMVKNGDRSQKLLQEQFFHSLTKDEQSRVLYVGAVFGAIRLAADQGRQLYKKLGGSGSGGAPATVHIEIPQFE